MAAVQFWTQTTDAGVSSSTTRVVLGGPRERWTLHWNDVQATRTWDCGDCLPGRNHQTVWVAREPRGPLAELWPRLRVYE